MALDAALAAAEEINAPQTYFIHMCHDLGHAETAAILPERIQLAFDGLRIEL